MLLAEPNDAVHNEHMLYQEALFQAMASAGALSFLAVFLVRLDAPNWLVGLNTSLPALMKIIVVLPIGAWVQRQPNLIHIVNRTRFIFRGTIAGFALLPYLPRSVAPFVMVAVWAIASIPDAALYISWTTIMGQVTTPQRRARMLSTRQAIMGLFAAGLGFLSGQWLDWAPYPLNYQLLFISAFVAGLGSIWAFSNLRLPLAIQSAPGRARAGLRQTLGLVRSTPSFRNYAVATFLFRIGMHMPMALYALYRVRELGASDAWLGILMTVERLLNVVSYSALSRWLPRPRFRRMLWIGCLGMALYPFTTALATRPEALLFPSVLLGIFAPAMNIFLTDTLFLVSPEEQRPTFVAADTFLANITAFGAPMLGTLLGDLITIPTALMIGAAVRVVGGMSFFWLNVGAERKQRMQTRR